MKKYYIFLGINMLSFILFTGIPQLTGEAFIKDYKGLEPADWFSALLLKNYSPQKNHEYTIPVGISTIKIKGEYSTYGYVDMNVIESKNNIISTPEPLVYNIINDTLLIDIDKKKYGTLDFNLDSTIHKITFEKIVLNNVNLKTLYPLSIDIKDNSDITIISGQNMHNIKVADQSIFRLHNCFKPTLDVEVNNGMVYVNNTNHIDSLNVKLIGKSNIKMNHVRYEDDNFEELKKEAGIENPKVNFFISGNTQYVSPKLLEKK